MGKLNKKVAIVTGATSGIGRETAVLLSREGASVVFTGRNKDAAEETSRLILEEGGKSLFITHDVANEDNWVEVVKATKDHFGPIDILVNNAGQFFLKPIMETSLDDFNQICSVNIDGAWLGMKHCLSEMNDGGSIVNVSSLMGQMGLPDASGYCASKGAVTSMTKAAALEVADRNIKVNALHPGVIWTNMQAGARGATGENQNAISPDEMVPPGVPLGRVGKPEDIANCVLYLASDEANYVTGAEFTVDAGMTAH